MQIKKLKSLKNNLIKFKQFKQWKKMVVMIEPKTFYFDLPKDVDKNLKHEIESIIKTNESFWLRI